MAYMKTLTESDLFDSNNRQEFVKAELRKYIDRHNEFRIFAEQLSEFSKYSNDNQNPDVFESRGVHNYDIPYFYPPIDNEYIVTPEIPEELYNYAQTKYNTDNPQQKRDFNNLTYTQKMAFISSSLSQDMFDYNSYNAPEKNKTDKEKTQELYEQYLSFHLGIESLNEGYLPTHRKGSHANYNYQLENFYAAGGPSYLPNSVQDYESQMIALQIESIFEDYQTQVLDEIKDIEENVNPMLKKSQLSQIEIDSIRAEFERISDRFEEYKDYMRSKDDVFSLSDDEFAQEWISGLQIDLANLKAEITKSIGQKLKHFKYEESQQRSEEAKQEFGENPDTPLELDYIPEEIRIFQNAIDRKIPVPEQYLDFNEVLKDFIGTNEQKENLEELMRQYLKIWQSPATGYNQEGVPDEIYRESVLQPMEQIATIDPTIITNSDIDLSTLMQISYLPESSKEDNNASVANLAKNMLMDINPMKIPDEYSHINLENYKEQISSQHLLQNINLLVKLISQRDLSNEQIDSLKYICEEAIEHYNPTSGGAEIYQSIIPNLQRSRAQLVNSLQGEFSDQETQFIDDIIVQVGAKIETSHREYNKINGGLFDLPGSQNRAENKAKYQQTYIGKDNIASLINDIRSTLASLENYEESNDRKIFQRG
jgi:transcription termination factor NusB